VPAAPEDYIHRVGRTGRAELTGDAFTFVAPDEEADFHAIERAVHKTLPRVTLPDFNYKGAAPQLEVPRGQRIAESRRRKTQERQQAKLNEARRGARVRGAEPQKPAGARPHGPRPSRPGGPSSGSFRSRNRRRPPG
jgi:ATP-dependent RNA helicase RhlE